MRPRVVIAMMLAVTSTGCMFKKKTAPPPPPAPIVLPLTPTPAPAPPLNPIPTPAPSPTPIPNSTSTKFPDPAELPKSTPKPPPPKPVVRRQRNPPVPVPAPVQEPVATPTPPPQLGEILTPAEQLEMSRTVDQSTLAARAALTRLQSRNLNSAQSETASRIKTFADQADQARKTDLRSAVQLARRAEVLARDLESSIK